MALMNQHLPKQNFESNFNIDREFNKIESLFMDDAGASFSIQRKKKEQPEFKLKKNTLDKVTKSLHKNEKSQASTQPRKSGNRVVITEENN